MAEMDDWTQSVPPAEWADLPGRVGAQRDELDRIVEALNELPASISAATLQQWRRERRGSPPFVALSHTAPLAADTRTQRIAGTPEARMLRDIDYTAVFAGQLSPLQLDDVARNRNRRVSRNSYWLRVQRQRSPYDPLETGLAHVMLQGVQDDVDGAPRYTTRVVLAQIRQRFQYRRGARSGPRDSERFALHVTTMDTRSGAIVFRQRAPLGLVFDGTDEVRCNIAENLLVFLVSEGVRKSYRDQADMREIDAVLQRFRRVMVPVSRAFYAPLAQLDNAQRTMLTRSVFDETADVGRIFRTAYVETQDRVPMLATGRRERDDAVADFLQQMATDLVRRARALPYQINQGALQRLWLDVWYPQLELVLRRLYESNLNAQEDELTDSEATEELSLTESEAPSDSEETLSITEADDPIPDDDDDDDDDEPEVVEIDEDDDSGSTSPFIQYACPFTFPEGFFDDAVEIGDNGPQVADMTGSDEEQDEEAGISEPLVTPPPSPIRLSVFADAKAGDKRVRGDDYDSADETEVVDDDVQDEEASPDPRYFRGMIEIRVIRKPDEHPAPDSMRYVYAWRYWALRGDKYVVQNADINKGWVDNGMPLILTHDEEAKYMILYCGLGPSDPNLPVVVCEPQRDWTVPVWNMRRNFYVGPNGSPSDNKAVLYGSQFEPNKFYLIAPYGQSTAGFRLYFLRRSEALKN